MKDDYTTNSHYITYTFSQNVGRMYFWTVIGSGKLNCRTCLAAAMDASLSPETGEMTYWLTRRWNGFMVFGLFLWPASTSFFRSQLNGAQHWRYGAASAISKAPSKRVGDGSLEGFVEHCELFLSGLLVQMPRNRFPPLVQLRNSLATLSASIYGQVQSFRAVRAQRNISSFWFPNRCNFSIHLAAIRLSTHFFCHF